MSQHRRAKARPVHVVSGAVAVALAAALVATPAQATAVQATTVIADYSFSSTAATMADVRRIIRADVVQQQGYTGKGIGIALIDTGVVAVDGLTAGNIANGPDLSLESQIPGLYQKDTYGHGTHMAGIIAGRGGAGNPYRGIAPDAKLTSIKVGMANGAVDVTQMIAAVDWVVEHRNDDPANPIRVLNLSYGTDSTLGWAANPLSYAVHNAYLAGILVVVAAGNTGGALTNPASDPYVFTVGATDMQGTTNPANDTMATFSSFDNTGQRHVDILAPGKSIVSLRNPGSYADLSSPTARVGDQFFKGSGTSQAAAVMSGAAAVFLQKYPTASPDSAKCNLHTNATTLASSTAPREVNLEKALASFPYRCYMSGGPVVTGTGSIQAARGTSLVTLNGVALTGERDIFGPLSSATWAAASKNQTAWQGGNWMGRPWTGAGWTTATGGQASWSGRTWSGRTWSGRTWSELAWSGATWTGRTWSNTTVNGVNWAGRTWSGVGWLSGGNGSWMI
jgi:serine protease AprX